MIANVQIDRVVLIRAAMLYVPTVLTGVVALYRAPQPRLFAAALVSFFWTLPSLLALQILNLRFQWWTFHVAGGLFRYMPLDLYLGWAVLWSILPILLFRRTAIPIVAAVFCCADLVFMPLCAPAVELHQHWLFGEYVAVAFVLLPSLYFARWTLDDRRLNARAVMQVITAVSLFLFVFPEIVFALRGGNWKSLLTLDRMAAGIWIQLLILAALPSISAVQEFAIRGLGTPIPYDPPRRLVTSGIYRYLANPMQVGCALSMGVWGAMLRNPWIVLAMFGTALYSLTVAGWDERADLDQRFGEPWRKFRREVCDWRPRWRPYVDLESPRPRLYIAATCGICAELRRWLERRVPLGLEFIAAESHPTRNLTRVTYDAMDGSADEQGIRAFARALEHINLAWALVGALMRLPILATVIQVLADAAGLGPRNLDRANCQLASPHSPAR